MESQHAVAVQVLYSGQETHSNDNLEQADALLLKVGAVLEDIRNRKVTQETTSKSTCACSVDKKKSADAKTSNIIATKKSNKSPKEIKPALTPATSSENSEKNLKNAKRFDSAATSKSNIQDIKKHSKAEMPKKLDRFGKPIALTVNMKDATISTKHEDSPKAIENEEKLSKSEEKNEKIVENKKTYFKGIKKTYDTRNSKKFGKTASSVKTNGSSKFKTSKKASQKTVSKIEKANSPLIIRQSAVSKTATKERSIGMDPIVIVNSTIPILNAIEHISIKKTTDRPCSVHMSEEIICLGHYTDNSNLKSIDVQTDKQTGTSSHKSKICSCCSKNSIQNNSNYLGKNDTSRCLPLDVNHPYLDENCFYTNSLPKPTCKSVRIQTMNQEAIFDTKSIQTVDCNNWVQTPRNLCHCNDPMVFRKTPDKEIIPHGNFNKAQSIGSSSEKTIILWDKNTAQTHSNSNQTNQFMSDNCCSGSKVASNNVARCGRKVPKLQIQTMPPLNIGNKLVLQKTLQLSIKPSESLDSEINSAKTNVGYEEVLVSVDKDGKKVAKQPDESTALASEANKPKDVIETVTHSLSENSKNSKPNNALTANTKILYQSFQIIEKNIIDSRNSSKPETSVDSLQISYQNSKVLDVESRNPMEIGLYKSQSTQYRSTRKDVSSESQTPHTFTRHLDIKANIIETRDATENDKTDEDNSAKQHQSPEKSNSSSEKLNIASNQATKENFSTYPQKVDVKIQVSFDSLSESESSVRSTHSQKRIDYTNPVTSFIKGLTGTSEEQIDRYRSVPNFKQSGLIAAREPNKDALKYRQQNMGAEEIVETVDYSQEKPIADDADTSIDSSEKKEKLKKFKRLFSRKLNDPQADKSEKNKIVMSLTHYTTGEGDKKFLDSLKEKLYDQISKNITDEPTYKTSIPKSVFDTSPVDNSVSEGEIKYKSSLSVGEIKPIKLHGKTNRNSSSKSGEKNLRVLSDQSQKIMKQRKQYNQWVTHYLQKQQKYVLNYDFTSSSSQDNEKL